MKKVFLHIGPPKTGSTTIQAFLSGNKDNLYNAGYFYPKTGIIPNRPKAHHNLAWQLAEKKEFDPSLGTWKELHQEVEYNNLNNVILSSEFFGVANKNQIELLKSELKPYEVKIIVYLRRQDLGLESLYTQRVKNGSCNIDILSFFEQKKKYFDYARLLKPWKKVFGTNNIAVRPLEKSQIPNICYDILKVVGFSDYDHFNEVDSKNIKPGIKTLEILKFANEIYKNVPKSKRKKYTKRIKNYLYKNWPEERKYRVLSFSDSVEIVAQYQQSNQSVAREYLRRKDGILFYEKPEEYESENITMKDLSKEELISLIEVFQVSSKKKKKILISKETTEQKT